LRAGKARDERRKRCQDGEAESIQEGDRPVGKSRKLPTPE